MPLIVKSTHQKYKKQATGGDYNMPSPVLKDRLHIVSASDEISKQISTGFRYTVGNKELEVYVNGLLMRVKENLNGSEYGDYYETSNYFITFDSGVINENDQIRFRMTSNSYDYSNTNTSDIQQLGKDTYGNMFQVSHDGQRHDRTIGTFVDGDTTPNIDDYRTYQTNNSSDTYITNFDGGKIEDIRHIIFKDNHTYLSSGSGLNIFGGTQFKGKTGDMVLAIYDGSE